MLFTLFTEENKQWQLTTPLNAHEDKKCNGGSGSFVFVFVRPQFPMLPREGEGLVDLGSWCPCLLPINQAVVLNILFYSAPSTPVCGQLKDLPVFQRLCQSWADPTILCAAWGPSFMAQLNRVWFCFEDLAWNKSSSVTCVYVKWEHVGLVYM